MKQITGWFKKVIGPAAAILLTAGLLCEIVLRISGISYLPFYQYDECCGYSLRPGYEGWFRDEGESYLRITKDGLRDRERQIEKPENTLRIAVFGDSCVEAVQVPLEQTFCKVLEKELAASGAKKIEVINFGVGGYGTSNELLLLKFKGWRYSPDIVVLCVTTANDLLDNIGRYHQYQEILNYYQGSNDYFDLKYIKYNLKVTALKIREFFLCHLRLVQAFVKIKNEIEKRVLLAYHQDKMLHPLLEEAGIKNEIYQEPTTNFWQEAWSVTEKLILEMRDEVHRRGVEFLVVTMVNSPQCYPDAGIRQEFLKLLNLTDLFYPDYRIKKLGEREGFEVLNLAPLFQEYADKHQVFLTGFKNSRLPGRGHWNAAGHRLAGKILARKFHRKMEQDGRGLN